MKIRTGFVSNSSTSSFCIFGTNVKETKSVLSKARAAGLKAFWGDPNYNENDVYIGISWPDIKPEETGQQFMDRIEKAVQEITGEPTECCTYEEGWYNG